MLGWCIVTLASARLKASVWFPPLRGMYKKEALARGATFNNVNPNGENIIAINLKLFHIFFLEN